MALSTNENVSSCNQNLPKKFLLSADFQKACSLDASHVQFGSLVATDAIENVTIRGKRLPVGIYGLNANEVGFYNYYTERQVEDKRLIQSQFLQDLWVAYILNCWNGEGEPNNPGFFVEFGAFDGITLSNSYFLEKALNWNGIIAEPNPEVFAKIKGFRSCHTDQSCVWSRGGETIVFNKVAGNEILGTVDQFSQSDKNASIRIKGRNTINVKTKSLSELLDEFEAPRVIDYISIDTEGSEFKILQHFDFDKYSFKVLSVEHNEQPEEKSAIRLLLSKNGHQLLSRSTEGIEDMFFNPNLIPKNSPVL